MAKSRQLTPAQLDRIAELKNKSKPAPVVTPDPVVPATQDDTETFLKEEFPDPVPAAVESESVAKHILVEPEPVAPEQETLILAPEPETPAEPEFALLSHNRLYKVIDIAVIPDAPAPEPIDPAAAFRAWLRTPQGLNASDPRLPEDPVRRAIELEDALLLAFRAGFNLTAAV